MSLLIKNLKHNLLNISQLCDNGYCVVFESSKCLIEDACSKEVIFIGDKKDNIYTIDVEIFFTQDKCFSVLKVDYWIWYRRLGHAGISIISTLSTKILVDRLPSLIFEKEKVCDACQFCKQVKSSFKSKKFISTSRPLQLFHMDLFGPFKIDKHYAFVIVDDFLRFI